MMFENMKRYGKIFAVYIGRLPAIVILDPDVLKQILVKDFSSFRNRSDAGKPPPPLENNLFAARNEQWKRISQYFDTFLHFWEDETDDSTYGGCS